MDNKMTIGFRLEDGNGGRFSSESSVEVCYDLGDTDLSVIGVQFNCFLNQCGYIRRYSHMFMEDVTEEECEALANYLEKLREGREHEE